MARIHGFLMVLIVGAVGCAPPPAVPKPAGGYLFCFWNTENFFDDKVNGWHSEPDKTFDRWFAEDRAAFTQKIKNLSEVLVALNDGRGPDILALAEVEAESQSANVLLNSLNSSITPGTPPYQHVLMMNPHGGRNI